MPNQPKPTPPKAGRLEIVIDDRRQKVIAVTIDGQPVPVGEVAISYVEQRRYPKE